MMIVAGCAVLFNIVLGLVLHGICKIPHSHSHGGHGHNHQHLSKAHEHLTSSSKLHSDSESDNDDSEDSHQCEKQVRPLKCLYGINLQFLSFFLLFHGLR